MNIKDAVINLGNFWKEFRRAKTGIVGLVMLLFFILLAVFGSNFIPFPDATEHWHDINYWQDNPSGAPPVWFNIFLPKKGAESLVIKESERSEETLDNAVIVTYRFSYDFRSDEAPKDLILTLAGEGQVPVRVVIERPDGLSVSLYSEQLDLSNGQAHRVSIDRNTARNTIDFIRSFDEDLASVLSMDLFRPVAALFAKTARDMIEAPEALKGVYIFMVSALMVDPEFVLADPVLSVSGSVSGLLGTDLSKRDVFTGIIVGIRWALIIGLMTSLLTVILGVLLGVVSAYLGGAVDWMLNRFYEFIYQMPVLPFLIVLSAVFKPSIWTLIVIICLFFWTGPYKPVYTMALQIREETFVEASKALGSGRWRIMFRHIIPILLPYSFAVMALSVPSVIVFEASISLIGLGDATIVTWGQILRDAFTQGAVINNLWWWVVPPGLMIALMGMSFAFLGTALDKILHPKLRTR